MVEIVRRRLNSADEEDQPWVVGREVKRLEKTGGFLRSKIGLQAYFPRSLDVMRYEAKRSEAGPTVNGRGGGIERRSP